MAVWETVVADVASVLQIIGVDVATLLISLTAGVASCKMERAKLKQRASEFQALARLPTGHDAEAVMRAAGLWEEAMLAVRGANHLVEAYDKSSIFHVVCNSRRMERDMFAMRRRVSICYDLAVGIHAGIAVMRAHAGHTLVRLEEE